MASNKEEGEVTDVKQHEENGTKSNEKEDSPSIHLKKVGQIKRMITLPVKIIYLENLMLAPTDCAMKTVA